MRRLQFLVAAFLLSRIPCLAAPSLTDSHLQVQELVSGLDSPTTMAFIGPDDILVLQKNDGRVRRVIGGILQAGEVLDVNVHSSSERGLLGIALHPAFPATPYVYLYFTESSTGSDTSDASTPLGNRIYRYTWNGSALVNPVLILSLPATPGPNHDGGIITFGPDGKLYAVIGDLNRNGQLQNFSSGPAPDDTSVVFRLNDDGTVPPDNPFAAQGGNLARYYAYGIRNSFGMAFDPLTERLWITENGPDAYDEINLVEPGFNSGWEQIMGPDSRDPQGAADLFVVAGSHYRDPAFSWRHPVAPTGVAFLKSTALGLKYENDLFVGDINGGTLYRFTLNGARNGFDLTAPLADRVADENADLAQVVFGTGFDGITDVKVGPDGLLYVVSFGAGKIYVISPAAYSPLTLGASVLPEAEVGVSYSASLDIAGGEPPYDVALLRGSLPEGLAIGSGAIAGTPSENGKSSFVVQVTDSAGASVSGKLRIRVRKALAISSESLKPGIAGRKYRARVKAKGGAKPYAWSVQSGELPPGLALDSATGLISGIPSGPGSANLVIQVTDPVGGSADKSFVLVIE
ncbi:MAG TPA: PQQ-dependent sugar dehydrogenase [Candidatus Acidoferrales bacterium]|nr:PQQ-dependent sugar dehydrogenase [Candidatus Acidoferrales bacterium]